MSVGVAVVPLKKREWAGSRPPLVIDYSAEFWNYQLEPLQPPLVVPPLVQSPEPPEVTPCACAPEM